jgi:hypothetical protein
MVKKETRCVYLAPHLLHKCKILVIPHINTKCCVLRFPVICNYKNMPLQDVLPQFLDAKICTTETDGGSTKTVARICQTARSNILIDHNLNTQQGATTHALSHIPSRWVKGWFYLSFTSLYLNLCNSTALWPLNQTHYFLSFPSFTIYTSLHSWHSSFLHNSTSKPATTIRFSNTTNEIGQMWSAQATKVLMH